MAEQGAPLEGILQQAVRFEEDAYSFYTRAVQMVKREHIKEVLRDMAAQEVKHKEKLQGLLQGNVRAIIATKGQKKVEDLKLAEYLVPRPLANDASFQDVLIVAMHREKSSHEFYSTMAQITEDRSAKDLFDYLAQEELVHKNKVESLYDEAVYKEF